MFPIFMNILYMQNTLSKPSNEVVRKIIEFFPL